MAEVSNTTQAILLLVAPLTAGGRTERGLTLKPAEYTRLAGSLQQLGSQPSDLLGKKASGILAELETDFDRDRLSRLLDRGMQLGLSLERWGQYSIQVISRADAGYPRRLKKNLRYESPSLLYICGDADLLQDGGLAVVGSRKADQELLRYTRRVGVLAAAAGSTIVSGGARGVDQASMQGAAEAGGRVVGVLANGLEKAVINPDSRMALREQRMALCSACDPAAGFKVWQAMDRNKLIYALADAALVVESDVGKGGTWSGAKEQIRNLRCVPVFTRTWGPRSQGLEALRELGARPWPEPGDVDEFRHVMATPATPSVSVQQHLLPAAAAPAPAHQPGTPVQSASAGNA